LSLQEFADLSNAMEKNRVERDWRKSGQLLCHRLIES
jgi:hypothetical protein